jgi:dipeptidyl aminopeptidase/acylaminoacyl peptidase
MMPRHTHRIVFAIAAAVAAIAAWPFGSPERMLAQGRPFGSPERTLAQGRRPITEKDLFKFVWIADPQMAPDGSQVAFVRVTVDEKKDQYENGIWIVKTDGSEPPRQLTTGIRDSTPRWSPDNRRLTFVRSAEKDGKPQPAQIYLLSMAGGEGRGITDIPRGAGNPVWSPDGKTIAFSTTARADEIARKDASDAKKPEDKPHESDVRVITEAVYRANGVSGSGFVDRDRPSHVWTVLVPDALADPAAPRQITSGEFSEGNYKWSADGKDFYFVSDRRRESYYYPRDSDLYAVSRDGGEPRRLVSIEGSIGAYAIAPDGKRVAFVGTLHGEPERSYSQSDLWVADVTGGAPRNMTASYDFDIDGGVGGDQRAPRGQNPGGPVWSRDGSSVLVKVGERGDANIVRVNVASGRIEALTKGSHEIVSYTADAAGSKLALIRSTPTVVGDLQVLDIG